MCVKNHNHMIYSSWDTEWDRQNILSFWTIFCSFTPLTTRKIKLWKNEKNTWRYYHFTHAYHKWQSYNVWFKRYELWWKFFLSFWTVFCPFTPITTQKIKILKKWKKYLEILSFYTCAPKIIIIWYTVPKIWHATGVSIIFHFELFFALLPP